MAMDMGALPFCLPSSSFIVESLPVSGSETGKVGSQLKKKKKKGRYKFQKSQETRLPGLQIAPRMSMNELLEFREGPDI